MPSWWTRIYCRECDADFKRGLIFNSGTESSEGRYEYCPLCGSENIVCLADELERLGWKDAGYGGGRLSSPVVYDWLVERDLVEEKLPLSPNYKIRGTFVRIDDVERARKHVLSNYSSAKQFEKAAETREEIAVVHEGRPLYYRKDEPGRTRRKKFKLDEKDDELEVLYTNDGERFGTRICEEEASRELKAGAMAKALHS